ncbi:hypothetical protein B0H13DRAFT_1915744 [Mycena leptocephala]|nr:hypothetical protein B0H13DRAFT_1915744 [Mycena leptocephala]
MHPPPLTSKYNTGLTEHELKLQRQAVRREKARVPWPCTCIQFPHYLSSADATPAHRRRAELKSRPLEEQEEAAKRARLHQATYRAKNRDDLRKWEAKRRIKEKRRAKAAGDIYVDQDGNEVDMNGPNAGRFGKLIQ